MKYPIRSMFIPSPGMLFLALDLSQAETWCVAHFALEHNMIAALTTGDIHSSTARAIFNKQEVTKEERYIGKRLNHALAYRMSAERLAQVFNSDAQDTGIHISLKQARDYHSRWHNLYNMKTWWKSIEGELGATRTLTTPYGRKRVFYEAWGPELFKEATAFLPQSTVADHTFGRVQPELGIKGGLLEIHKWCKSNHSSIVHTAHDSVLLEIPKGNESSICPEVVNLFRRPMVINGLIFTIPVEVEVGDRWGQLEKIVSA